MAIRDLIPWNRGNEVNVRNREEAKPFLTLHREMNRLFDDVFRGFDLAPFGAADRFLDRATGWPHIEVSETDKDIKVSAELPGLEDKDRRFSERFYGQFERRIPVEDIDEGKVTASFKNGVLTVTLPKTPTARERVKRIAINGK
jgi:HSP20 family protein